MTCVHVYQMVGADLCPHCGLTTHETDWAETNEKHRAWKEYVIDHPQEQRWWSI